MKKYFIYSIALLTLGSCNKIGKKTENLPSNRITISEEFKFIAAINESFKTCRLYPQMRLTTNEGLIETLEINAEAGCFSLLSKDINHLKQLRSLKINNTALERIENIDSLKNLAILDLSYNYLSDTFITSQTLNNLQFLNLFRNKLSNIKFKGYIPLKKLSLVYNQISEIDSSFNYLQDLDTLYLNHNKISDIDLRKLKNLQYVDLSNNPVNDTATIKLKHKETKIKFKF